MKFEIYSTKVYPNYHSGYSSQKLIEEYPCLKGFGFEIVKYEEPRRRIYWDGYGHRIHEIVGTDTLYKACVTIDTIEQLMALQSACEESLIITEDEIEIYDGYRE